LTAYPIVSMSRGATAAGGIAPVDTITTLGVFFGTVLIGMLKAQTGNFAAGMAARRPFRIF
jgi:hypothetical protein